MPGFARGMKFFFFYPLLPPKNSKFFSPLGPAVLPGIGHIYECLVYCMDQYVSTKFITNFGEYCDLSNLLCLIIRTKGDIKHKFK